MVEDEKKIDHEILFQRIGITDKQEQVKVLDFLHTLSIIALKTSKKNYDKEERENRGILKIGA